MKHLTFLLALPLVLSLLSFSKPATPPFHFEYEYDIDGYFWNNCTGEWVYLTGKVQFDAHYVINNNRVNISFHNTFRAEGVGTSTGIHYISNENENYSSNYPIINGAATFSIVDKWKFISQGNAPNQIISMLNKFIVNANGEFTASKFDFNFECR